MRGRTHAPVILSCSCSWQSSFSTSLILDQWDVIDLRAKGVRPGAKKQGTCMQVRTAVQAAESLNTDCDGPHHSLLHLPLLLLHELL